MTPNFRSWLLQKYYVNGSKICVWPPLERRRGIPEDTVVNGKVYAMPNA